MKGSTPIYSDERFLELYKEGLNDSEIGRKMGCDNVTITMKRRKYKLEKNFRYTSKIDKEKFIQLHKEGYSTKQLCNHFGVSDSQVNARIQEWGLIVNLPQNKIKEVTEQEEQIILGMTLGDGSLSKSAKGKNAGTRITYAHGLQQEEYARYKANLLKRFIGNIYYREEFHKKRQKVYKNISISGTSHIILNQYYDMFYKDGVKVINKEIIDKLSPLGVAIWYMDDGMIGTHGGYYISTNGFQWNDVIEAAEEMYKKFDIKISVVKSSINQPMMYISVGGGWANKFELLVKDHIIGSMRYKLQPDGKSIEKGPHRPGIPIIVEKDNTKTEYSSVLEASRSIGICRSTIDKLLKGKRKWQSWKTKDYRFRYKQERSI